MSYRYLVLGSGMQGVAGGFYLSKYAQASEVAFADIDLKVAQAAAERCKNLNPNVKFSAHQADACDHNATVHLMKGFDGVFSAIHYKLNYQITEAAIEAGCHLIDLGGNTDVVRKQHELNLKAKEAGVTIIPDCGLAPGLGNTLAAACLEDLDEAEEINVRCGGLAQEPKGPLGYKLVFAISGLTNEYFGKAWVIRNHELQQIDTFDELEHLEFKNPIGKCEAFVTSGGTSTAPWNFKGKVKNFDYKTVRYPGHYEKFKVLLDLGLLDEKPIKVGNSDVSPRDVFHEVASKSLDYPEDKDLVVLRATGRGKKAGKDHKVQYEMILFHDNETNFTAMEMGTGYPAAHVLYHLVQKKCEAGVQPLETAISASQYLKELKEALPINH